MNVAVKKGRLSTKVHEEKAGVRRQTTLCNSFRRHLFTNDIMETELSPNWKGSTLDRYIGLTDPDEHIDIYVTQLGLYTTDGNILCKVFPTSLKEMTLGSLSCRQGQ